MDRKDYIIKGDGCHSSAGQFVPYANEAFLVTLANKGLYKRALKDLETTGQVELAVAGDHLQVQLDEITVSLNPNISQSSCSCPSKTVCKHILMGILVAADYAAKVVEEQTEEAATEENRQEAVSETVSRQSSANDWEELKKVDLAQLRKQAGKKLFEDTLRLIQDGWTADFIESDMLEATINTENITVYFPKDDSLNRSICKCGESGLCKHKLIAILSYLSSQGILSSESDGNQPELSLLTEETIVVLRGASRFITGIFEKGLIGCGENEAETAIQYSIRLETCGIGNLARLFRSLSSDIENMLAKHVGFQPLTTFATLSRLHNTLRLILRNTQNNEMLSKLIEGTRSDYYTTPIGHFTGLGAYPWQTRSGYFGITAYFFYHEKQSICTLTSSMADYYEHTQTLVTPENMRRQLEMQSFWGSNISLAWLSTSTLTLRNFKMNRQNRLSSSSQTQCEIDDKVTISSLDTLLAIPELSDLTIRPEQRYDYFRKKQPEQLALVPFTHLSEVSFNTAEQKLYFTMADEQHETEGSLAYSELNRNAIRRLEQMGQRYAEAKQRYMVCLKRPDTLIPVSIVTASETDNFYF
ncbi:SWIM zinc finger family protein [uncultured Parabacteroides sp.]|uniref:SWIM zinc finger family protein n=1 Tax=uncultured Parabacteroides sp. TaxID=512312 RepID=UPI00258C0499|nr:SWIM zinc finger family protein [uncultured Parabacteroides sp.]